MNVFLMEHTPNPENLVASAAKLCYSPSSIDELKQKTENSDSGKFVKMLSSLGHESPLEHVSFTFGIEGVSRALLAQLTRHRIASYSVQSQRYVTNFGFEYILPEAIENCPEAKKEFLTAMEESQKHYDKISQILINKYSLEGKSAQSSEKCAIEDARYVLPNACTTKIICTFNARSLLNFFKLRCCNRAQREIRELATAMLKKVKPIAPNIFSEAGPECCSGACSEGKMSCGKSREMREFFKNLS